MSSSLKQSSVSQAREKSQSPLEHSDFSKSMTGFRIPAKRTIGHYHDRSQSKSPNYSSKRQKNSITNLKNQLHNIKSQVSRIIGRNSPDRKKAKEKQFNDKSSFFKSECDSVDLNEKLFEKHKTSEVEVKDEQFNYFKIEYEICIEEYHNLKKKYMLQKSQHKDRVSSLNKKIRFLENLLEEKEAHLFEYKTQIQTQLSNIRHQLIEKTSLALSSTESRTSESSDPQIISEYSKMIQQQQQAIRKLTEEALKYKRISDQQRANYDQSKKENEGASQIIHELRIANGSLNKRLEEVELTKHHFEQARIHQQNLRMNDHLRMSQLHEQLRIRDQKIQNFHERMQSFSHHLNVLSIQNKQLKSQRENEKGEETRKVLQLQLQLESMLQVVNKVQTTNSRLEKERNQLKSKIEFLQSSLDKLKQSMVTVSENKIQNTISCKDCEVQTLSDSSSSQIIEIQKIEKKPNLLQDQLAQVEQSNKQLKERLHVLTLQNQNLSNSFASKLLEEASKNCSDSNRQLTLELCNKIKNMSEQLVSCMRQNQEIRFSESEKREKIMKSKNQELMSLEMKYAELKDIFMNQSKGTIGQKPKTVVVSEN